MDTDPGSSLLSLGNMVYQPQGHRLQTQGPVCVSSELGPGGHSDSRDSEEGRENSDKKLKEQREKGLCQGD
jgi:hypothetical protein